MSDETTGAVKEMGEVVSALEQRIAELERENERLKKLASSGRVVRMRPQTTNASRPDVDTWDYEFALPDATKHLVVQTLQDNRFSPDQYRMLARQMGERFKAVYGDHVVPLIVSPGVEMTVLELSDVDERIDPGSGRTLEELKHDATSWRDAAADASRNAEFWRGIVHTIGTTLGPAAYVSDDGSVQDTPLALKLPMLVQALVLTRDIHSVNVPAGCAGPFVDAIDCPVCDPRKVAHK